MIGDIYDNFHEYNYIKTALTSGTTFIVSSLGRGFSVWTTAIHCLTAEIS